MEFSVWFVRRRSSLSSAPESVRLLAMPQTRFRARSEEKVHRNHLYMPPAHLNLPTTLTANDDFLRDSSSASARSRSSGWRKSQNLVSRSSSCDCPVRASQERLCSRRCPSRSRTQRRSRDSSKNCDHSSDRLIRPRTPLHINHNEAATEDRNGTQILRIFFTRNTCVLNGDPTLESASYERRGAQSRATDARRAPQCHCLQCTL